MISIFGLPPMSPYLLLAIPTVLTLCFCVAFLLCRMSLKKLQEEYRQFRNMHAVLVNTHHQLDIDYTKILAEHEAERKHHTEKLTILENAREELGLQFQHLAHEIFEEKSQQFSETNKEKLDALLSPLGKDLHNLQEKIQTTHLNDTRERAALKQELFDLRRLNVKMTEEAANLTRALKGDKKLQGNWGELVLERALESSGLRKGIEFDTQGSYRNHEDALLRPDVIIRLPESKSIIVDSKVSLVNWERSVASETKEEQQLYIQKLDQDIRNHIKGLSGKNYGELEGLESLDFVLLFMPIETAFTTVVEADPDIITYALKAKIVITTPTTLLATLKTIENIWRSYQQSQNSQEIAKKAGLMHDKFRLFLEDMEKLGRQLSTCQKSYDGAVNKLCQGRGNLVSQTEQLRELGVQVIKKLPTTFIENSQSEVLSRKDGVENT